MESEDLQRELDSLWKRVTSGPVPEAPGSGFLSSAPSLSVGDISSMTRDASMEAISYIRKQHNQELLRIKQYSELKDRSVKELTERLRLAEQEVVSLRGRSERGDQALLGHMESVSTELEDARRMMSLQEARFREEEKVLRGIAERTREQLAAESSRWTELERQWAEREQQYLLDIRSLQARAEKAMEESARLEGRSRQAVNDLKDARNAIESTLAELLKERREREFSDKEREKAVTRVGEVEAHMKDLQLLWEEERRQWQELWDRERSTWDSQKREFANWEGKLRTERQEWHKQLGTLREREGKFHEAMAESMRKSAAVGDKVTSMLQFAASKAVDIVGGGAATRAATNVSPVPGIAPPRPLNWRRALLAFAVGGLLLASVPVWKHMHRLRIDLLESYALRAESPTGIAYDGNVLWLSEWSGRFSSLDPEKPSEVLLRQMVSGGKAYHPNSLAVWGDSLFSFDSGQGRVVRHALSDPSKIAVSWPSPGPAPVALAHNGQNLWSYDAANRAVYRHLGEGKGSQAEAYKMELDILPSAMSWFKDELWMYDIKNRQVMVFKVEGKALQLVQSKKFETTFQAILLTYRADGEARQQLELWGLHVPEEGAEAPSIKKYRITR